MSFILKALKKLEQEKADRRVGPPHLETAILAGSRSKGPTSRLLKVGVTLLVFVAGCGATYLLTHFAPATRTDAQPRVIAVIPEVKNTGLAPVTPAEPVTAAAPVTAPAPITAPARVTAGAPVTTTAPAVTAPRPAVRPNDPPSATLPQEESSASGETIRPSLQRRSRRVADSRRNSETVAPAAQRNETPPPAGLKVSGIALQDDPRENIAVINGTLVKKGMSVDGAKVEEIFHDRVRFSSGGSTFQVQVAK